MSTKNGDKYVNWRVFTWIIGIIVVALGAIFSIILVSKVDIAVIKTDINYIKNDIIEIKNTLTANVGMVVPEDIDFSDKVFADESVVFDPDYIPPTEPPVVASIVEPIKHLPISNDPEVIKVLESMGIATNTPVL